MTLKTIRNFLIFGILFIAILFVMVWMFLVVFNGDYKAIRYLAYAGLIQCTVLLIFVFSINTKSLVYYQVKMVDKDYGYLINKSYKSFRHIAVHAKHFKDKEIISFEEIVVLPVCIGTIRIDTAFKRKYTKDILKALLE